MGDVCAMVVACIPCVCFFYLATFRLLGALQQSGYSVGGFWRWLRRKDNLYFNRLTVWAGLAFFSVAVVAACFLPLGADVTKILVMLPFFFFCLLFVWADRKYALKVQTKKTARVWRISAVYLFLIACAAYLVMAVCAFVAKLIGNELYSAFAFLPFTLLPMALPFLLCAAAAIEGVYATKKNAAFVKRAGQVLNERKNEGLLTVGVVGSYGKTSVKNILEKLLSVKYSVRSTPQSYNTPLGVARTVMEEGLDGKEVFIAEMGARKKGDVAELCRMVNPDYAIFTGVCAQHVASFGSEQDALEAKCEVVVGAGKVICGGDLREKMISAGLLGGNCTFVSFGEMIEDLNLKADGTEFYLRLGEERIFVSTKLLGAHSAENVAISAALALEMGLTTKEIEEGLRGLEFVAHRLELSESGGVYILDDGYNCNERGAKEAIEALKRFSGRKWIVTPGIVECGVLEEKINGELGREIAAAALDKVILVGDTLVGAVKEGYLAAGGDQEKLFVVSTLDKAKGIMEGELGAGDCVLFLNDLPDVY